MNYKDDELRQQKELRDSRIIIQLTKLVKAQDRLLIAYRLGRNLGSAPEVAQEARSALKKLGVEV